MSRVPFAFTGGVFSTKGMELPMGVHVEETKEARVTQTNASQYFLLNSMDRFQNASLGGTNILAVQNWNDFKLQKPAYLMNAFAERISIAEIRFPWFIPNITARNNSFWIRKTATEIVPNEVVVPVGFYTPAELIASLNGLLTTLYPTDTPAFDYDAINQIYSLSCDVNFMVYESDPEDGLTAVEYYSRVPSLLRTMGFSLDQIVFITHTVPMVGLPTNTLYTEFVDICSSKLMMNTDAQDGTSANEASKPSVVCRVFLADESSQVTTAPLGCRPMLIHRQFVNAKQTKWSSDQFIDWLDIQVYDQYGQLVPLPTYVLEGFPARIGAYPDFQITCLASEN
jgi:hypothetical protein